MNVSEGGLALAPFGPTGPGSGHSAIRASQCEATNLQGKGGGGLERRSRCGATLSSYRTGMSLKLRRLAGFSGGATAIPPVNPTRQPGLEKSSGPALRA